jgi:hypothetical protein
MNRTRAERNRNTRKKINRRLKLIRAKYLSAYGLPGEFVAQPHRLAKNKYEGRSFNCHTNNKTKRHIHGNYYPSRFWKKTDQQRIDAMDQDIRELPWISERAAEKKER